MTERAIRKLKKRFVLTAMFSFLLVMVFISFCILMGNLLLTRGVIRNTLNYIADYNGVLPEFEEKSREEKEAFLSEEERSELDRALSELFGIRINFTSPDFFYSTRYFAVLTDADGDTVSFIMNHILSVDEEEALEYVEYVLDRPRSFGRYNDFYYLVRPTEDGGKIEVFLDCGQQIAVSNRLLSIALLLIFFGTFLSFLLLTLLSGKIIQPEIRNAERQKEFITNASHELKTPLAVIRANTELMEMTNGENEWTASNKRQLDRMTALIQNLVMITRASEKDLGTERKSMDVSRAVRETTENFAPVAEQEKKNLILQIPEGILFMAEEGQIRTLVSLLVDNAIKYCDEEGEILVSLQKKGKTLRLTITNSFANGKDCDFDRFFDRFYRGDESHCTEKEGYGIGLSMAQQICEDFGGKIRVSWNDGKISFCCVLNS